jgi:hypothetical protein
MGNISRVYASNASFATPLRVTVGTVILRRRSLLDEIGGIPCRAHVNPCLRSRKSTLGLFQINRAINLVQKKQHLTTETLSHGDFKCLSQCFRVSVVQGGLSGLLGLIVNLQKQTRSKRVRFYPREASVTESAYQRPLSVNSLLWAFSLFNLLQKSIKYIA